MACVLSLVFHFCCAHRCKFVSYARKYMIDLIRSNSSIVSRVVLVFRESSACDTGNSRSVWGFTFFTYEHIMVL